MPLTSPRKSKLPPKKLVERAPSTSNCKSNLILNARGRRRTVTTMEQRIAICQYAASAGETHAKVADWANHTFRFYHGEAKSVTKALIEKGRRDMQLICDGYSAKDIFNMDETAFYYRMALNGTISMELSAGIKQDKARVTLCVGTNSSGSEKLPLLCIGKSMVPICFRGHDVEAELGVQYTSSKKGWMNSPIFTKWLEDLNSRMVAVDRKILLFVDNVSSHKFSELSNIRLEMLPKNTTSVLQPMDQGIIHALKSRIKLWKQVTAIVKAHRGDKNPYKADLLSALEYCGKAWQDISETTIANCWRKVGILNSNQITTPTNDLDGLMSLFKVVHSTCCFSWFTSLLADNLQVPLSTTPALLWGKTGCSA